MANLQALNYSETITRAEDKLLELSSVIFRARKLHEVEELVWTSNQIRIGLMALSTLTPDELPYQQIIVGLHSLASSDLAWP